MCTQWFLRNLTVQFFVFISVRNQFFRSYCLLLQSEKRSISFQRSFGIGSDVQIILSRIVLTRTLEISKVSKFTCIRYRLTWVSRLGIQSYKKVFIWILNGMNDRKRVMTKFVIITLYHIDIFQTFVIIDYIFGKLISCVFLEL